MEATKGAHSTTDVSALANKDSDGINDLQSSYIEFSASAQTPYEGALFFSVPLSIAPVVAASLSVNYKGGIWDAQGLSFDVYDATSAQYFQIGNTFYAKNDIWSVIVLNFPTSINIAQIINGGFITLRFTAKGISPLQLDFVQLELFHEPPSPWYSSDFSALSTGGYVTSSHMICSTQGFVFAPHATLVSPPSRRLPEWAYGAGIADAEVGEDATDEEMYKTLSVLLQNGVTIAEVDNILSDWIADTVFTTALRTSYRWSTLAHNAGVATVWYYPALELISHKIDTLGSYSLSYPDELQIGLGGMPNKFYYPQVFWLDPGDESAWLSPNGPYVQKYVEKVKQVAVTGIDGIWMDVPVYFDSLVKWSDHSSWGIAAFKADTGLDVPTVKNWSDPVWRRWVSWRHDNILRYLLGIVRDVRTVNTNFQFFVETYVCDYHDATLAGYDGAYLRKEPGLTIVWEVSATSDSHGMRFAYEDDWTSLIAMYKYGRGAVDYSKPSWAFCYGIQSDDAISVMAEAISSGNAPYEVKTPGKVEGVPGDARRVMFNFINLNKQFLFNTISAARVAVLHSTPARDYVDNGEGNGLFCSMGPPTSLQSSNVAVEWYSDSGGPENDSCYKKQWIGEYRGIVKAMINSHIPFNILPTPGLDSSDLSPYKVLLAPDVQAISDAHAQLLLDFVKNGSTLVLTGSNPGGFNEYGDVRTASAFSGAIGTATSDISVAYGRGKVFWYKANVGWDYIKETSIFSVRAATPASPNYEKLISPILSSFVPQIKLTNAHRCIHMEANQRDDSILVLQFTNFIGICESDPETRSNFPIVEARFGVSVNLYSDRSVASLTIASPNSPVQTSIPFSRNGVGCNSAIAFDISVMQYTIVVVMLN
eukprot:Phypoly_transcript_02567.p1 GENE.Phypoly_transcript_02567~~Phypoly_transcript_02567.p1  ORF type:complete len:909 (+),score=91.92 Phypoly_transcript_02567:101-2728(+)